MRILGLDLGRKRIGVAMSDPMAIVAQGVKSIQVSDEAKAISEISDFVKENSVDEIVIGLPLNMDGSQGPMAQEAINFAGKLREKTGVSVNMRDERLTSLQIERDLIFMDVSRAKRKKINDMLAAQIILQNYLDSKKKE
ncbi:MAG: Holliday junction resolvase RuvX [Candidatus Omnitrophica bacterium]|nr:Holliday junction resolvase RuvX [Candidatus Omnitrophota bacterium]